jgi:tetratricopeptide (TPR) repeat protein
MGHHGILADPFWAHAYWARSRTAPTPASRISDLRWALRFDPDLHAARSELVVTLLRNGDSEFAAETVTLIRRAAKSFPAQQWGAFVTLTVIALAAMTALVLVALLAIGKSLPLIHHGLEEKLLFLPPEIRAGMSLLTLCAPLVLALTLPPTAALLWVTLFGSTAVWAVMGRSERRLCAAAGVAILISPFALAAWTRLAETSVPQSYLRCLWATQTSADPARSEDLRLVSPRGTEEDPDYHATLALAERRAGRYRRAQQRLSKATELDPERWEYHNNLGNVHLLSGRAEAALASYDRALELSANQPMVHVNRAQAWVQKLRFRQADEDIAIASRLGYQFPKGLAADPENIVVRDRVLGPGAVWYRFLQGAGFGASLPWGRAARMTVFLLLPMKPYGLAIPLYLALWWVSFARRLHRTFPCASCGKIISRKSQYRVLRRSLCAECFGIRQSVKAPLKRYGLLEARRRRVGRIPRAIGIVLSVLLPGSGHILRGNPRRAVFSLGIVALLAASALTVVSIGPGTGPPGSGFGFDRWSGALAFLYAVLMLVSLRSYLKSAQRPLESEAEKDAGAPSRARSA